MSVLILDNTTRAAIEAASEGANGGREAAVVTALQAAFGVGDVTRREYSSAGKLLRTIINAAVTSDTSSRPRLMRLGARLSVVTHATGTPERVVMSNAAGVNIVELSADIGGDYGLVLRAPVTLDEPHGGGGSGGGGPVGIVWATVPTIDFVEGTASVHDIAQYVSGGAGALTITHDGALPAGVTYDESGQQFVYDGVGGVGGTNSHILTANDSISAVTFGVVSAVGGANLPFSFGHVFAEGDLPADAVTDVSGVQIIAKNRWPDGSIKFAIVSGRRTCTANVTAPIKISAGTPAGAAISLGALQSAITDGFVTMQLGSFGTVDLFDLVSSTSSGHGVPGLIRTWLSGPGMSEWHFYSPVGSDTQLSVWFHVRMWAGGEIEVDTIVENGYANIALPVSKDYVATLTINGSVRYAERIHGITSRNAIRVNDTQLTVPENLSGTYPIGVGQPVKTYGTGTQATGTVTASAYSGTTGLTTITVAWDSGAVTPPGMNAIGTFGHPPHSRWMRSDFVGTDPQIVPVHDVAYMRATRMVPNYGYTTPSATVWSANSEDQPLLTTTTPAPFDQGNYRASMPGTGYSPTIAWVAAWDALYAASGDARAYRAMVANARLHGRFMVHYRDNLDVLRPIRMSRSEYATTGIYNDYSVGIDNVGGAANYLLSATTSAGQGAKYLGQQWDDAHSPSAGYIAYLATGRYMHLEEMQFVAGTALLNVNTSRRSAAPLAATGRPARANAWITRHLTQAYTATPDDDTAMRDNFGLSLDQTYAYYSSRIASAPWANNLGVFDVDTDYDTSTTQSAHAQFQFHYWTAVLSMAKDLKAHHTTTGQSNLSALLTHAYKHTVGLLGDASGWNYRNTPYQLSYGTNATIDAFPPTTWYASWSECFTANVAAYGLPVLSDAEGQSLTNAASIWADDALRGLWFTAAQAKSHGATGGTAAWRRISTSAPALAQEATFADNPPFMIVPR